MRSALALALVAAASLLTETVRADIQSQMSGEAQEPETNEDKFVDAARHGRFQEVRDMAAEGVHPDYYNDASVSWQRLKCTAFVSTAFSLPIGR